MEKYVVITKTVFDDTSKEQVMKLSEIAMDIYRKQPGLISARMKTAPNANYTVNIFEWESPDYHKASWRNPEFFEWNPVWQNLIKAGKVKWELHAYNVFVETPEPTRLSA